MAVVVIQIPVVMVGVVVLHVPVVVFSPYSDPSSKAPCRMLSSPSLFSRICNSGQQVSSGFWGVGLGFRVSGFCVSGWIGSVLQELRCGVLGFRLFGFRFISRIKVCLNHKASTKLAINHV